MLTNEADMAVTFGKKSLKLTFYLIWNKTPDNTYFISNLRCKITSQGCAIMRRDAVVSPTLSSLNPTLLLLTHGGDLTWL